MYKIGELKFKDNVSYTDMMTVAMQYAKNAMDGEADGFVVHDFAYICAVLYVFTDTKEETLPGDEVMSAVYSAGMKKYLAYIRDNTPMGYGYFDGFISMLDRADRAAEKRQPVDTLLDSLIKFADSATEFLKPGSDGMSGIVSAMNVLREVAANSGEATPAQ